MDDAYRRDGRRAEAHRGGRSGDDASDPQAPPRLADDVAAKIRRRMAARPRDHLSADRRARHAPRGNDDLLGGLKMRVTLWGTRGSLATPGPETSRYGGN